MSKAFVIGNGESRAIFPIEKLKGNGNIYGCNAIYRDNPDLCDYIVSVNPEMSEELLDAQKNNKISTDTKIYTIQNLPKFNYIIDGDQRNDPHRFWHGNDPKTGTTKIHDFATNRGSGCSAVHLACHDNNNEIFIIGFDILGSRQWEMNKGILSRRQNNMYKNSINYPSRVSMKAYLKFEWIYQLRQIARYYKHTNFYFINRLEYLEENVHLHQGMKDIENFHYGIYADLKKSIDESTAKINWRKY
tara:strand:+ start:407 stop:1144 length:738 start_codon:yes stop_codon:yes gene_type:complete